MTWNELGAKQVAVVGMEEKRASTLLPSITAEGQLLPMQAIWTGLTKKSLPVKTATNEWDDVIEVLLQVECSETDNYWSTFKTMCMLVDTSLVFLPSTNISSGATSSY